MSGNRMGRIDRIITVRGNHAVGNYTTYTKHMSAVRREAR